MAKAKRAKGNPFRPGAGRPPPYMAGRGQATQDLLGELDLMQTSAIGNTVFMHGPRGMGKTTLLGWLREECGRQKIDVVSARPKAAFRSVAALLDLLLPGAAPSGRAMSARIQGEVPHVGSLGVEVGAGPAAPSGSQAIRLAERLAERCAKTPLVFLLDEAHEPHDIDLLALLLQEGQEASGLSPFLLVLAGTPGLEATLKEARCTFTERHLRIGVGCIDEVAAADAIRVPMEEGGLAIAGQALARIVEDSQRYPYFLQAWGKALWQHAAQAGIRALGPQDVAAAEAAVQAIKEDFYDRRYRALERNETLLAAAQAVAAALKPAAGLKEKSLQTAIKSSLAPSAGGDQNQRAWDLLDELSRLDFVWHPPGTPFMEPGIPSFISYVQARAAQQP